MRYQVLNVHRCHLGQECTGDVCRIPPRNPLPTTSAPSGRSLSAREAAALGPVVQAVIDNNSTCFDGEDLSIAYSLANKLAAYGPSESGAFYRLAYMLDLSEDEARVLSQAEACYQQVPEQGLPAAPIQTMQPPVQNIQSASGAQMPAAPIAEAPASFPVVPVAVGAGALGLIALIVATVK